MKLIDTHVDTLTLLMEKGEELFTNTGHISIENLKKFKNSAIFFAIWLDKKSRENPFVSTMKVIDFYYEQLNKNKDHISHTNNYKTLLNNWDNDKISSLLSLEGSEALDGDLSNLQKFYDVGVRSLTLTWNNSNFVGHGSLSKNDLGLTDYGKKLVAMCNELNILVDISHINKKGFYDTIETTTKPLIATHSNAYTICEHPRNLTDNQIKELKKIGGILGLTYHVPFVCNHKDYEFEIFIKHLDHVMNIMGEDNVCLGSDFDGTDLLPCKIKNVSDNIPLYYFIKKAYNSTIADKIFYKNQLNFLKNNL